MASNAYLQMDGIKGESADTGHQGWIEISSAHWGVIQPKASSVSTAGGHTVGHCEHRTLSFSKLVDLASPSLMRQVRKDYLTSQAARVSYGDAVYDQAATIALIRLFAEHPEVRLILFNDQGVQKAVGSRVKSCIGHNDHFHVELRGRK